MFCKRSNVFISGWECEVSVDLDGLENIIAILDYTINTKRRKHITGGILMSISMLFGGLAFTVMTIKMEEISYEERT